MRADHRLPLALAELGLIDEYECRGTIGINFGRLTTGNVALSRQPALVH